PDHLLPDRLAAVLAVVYLIFNEGYGGRGDLAAEAIRLDRALAELMPDEPEVHALLALMRLHDARRDARLRDAALVLRRAHERSRAPRRATSRARSARSTASASTATTTSTRRAPSCCAGSTAPRTPARPTSAPWSSSTPTQSATSSSAG